tara:strand:- start:97 stop:753 length:657 start_codon:yes stop_codon:yes gene_type:complete
MESQIVDFYNELPHGINVIEKMNEEFSQLQKENEIIKGKLNSLPELDYMKNFQMPVIIHDNYKAYLTYIRCIDMVSEFSILDGSNAVGLDMENADIKQIIQVLDVLTMGKNPIWCEYRVKIALDLYNSFMFQGEEEICIFKNLVVGIDSDETGEYCDLPLTYRELSALHSPDNCDEYHNIYHTAHFKCPNCERILNHQDMKDNEFDEEDNTCTYCWNS